MALKELRRLRGQLRTDLRIPTGRDTAHTSGHGSRRTPTSHKTIRRGGSPILSDFAAHRRSHNRWETTTPLGNRSGLELPRRLSAPLGRRLHSEVGNCDRGGGRNRLLARGAYRGGDGNGARYHVALPGMRRADSHPRRVTGNGSEQFTRAGVAAANQEGVNSRFTIK